MASMTDFRWNLAIELLESVIINSYFFEEYSRKKNLPSLISNTIVNIEFWQGVLRLIEHIKPICIALDIVQSDSIRFGESIGVIVAISFANHHARAYARAFTLNLLVITKCEAQFISLIREDQKSGKIGFCLHATAYLCHP